MLSITDQLDAIDDALDGLIGADLTGLTRDELLAVLRRFEVLRRRLSVVDHRLVAEVGDRGLAGSLGASSTSALLRQVLRISAGEASARVRAGADLGPRRSLLGEKLAPLFVRVASAQAAGIISSEHARVVVRAVDQLPGALQAEFEGLVETELVAAAREWDPVGLQRLAARLLDVLNPDGTLAADADHERLREFQLVKHRDGSATPSGRFGPGLVALVEAFLDANGAPRPADDGTRDPRSAAQRNHDALQDGLTRLLGCAAPWVPSGATLLLTMTVDQYESRRGFARTAHGDPISIPTVLQLVSDGQTMSVLFDPHGGVLDYGQTKRLVPPAMRLALTVRDRGCTFPGCDRPPGWAQAHHFREYAEGGATSVANTGLVCGFHHREFARRGWTGSIINGRPHWTPPACIDPTQTPRRNRTHDLPLRT